MQHVHWWLFALSFFLGLALTYTLLKKGKPATDIPEVETPTTKIPVPKETATTKIPVAEKETPTTKIPVAEKETPTTKIPAEKETPTTKIPKLPFAPYGAGSARAGADSSRRGARHR